jgi:hypothetical protein
MSNRISQWSKPKELLVWGITSLGATCAACVIVYFLLPPKPTFDGLTMSASFIYAMLMLGVTLIVLLRGPDG